MQAYNFALATTRGARDYQEDAAGFWPDTEESAGAIQDQAVERRESQRNGSAIAVLADGMGGHAGGAVASKTVCDVFISTARDVPCDESDDDSEERLVSALRAANLAVADKVAESPMLSGMGSTLIGALFSNRGVEWISVGDSPLYLFRRGEIAVLNEDHSLAPELDRLVEEGVLSEADARSDPRRHMLRSAVTGEDIDLVDISREPLNLETGDYVILASDGIATLDQTEIARVVKAYAQDGPEAVAEALIRAVEAVREPFQDNATVLVARRLEDCREERAVDSEAKTSV